MQTNVLRSDTWRNGIMHRSLHYTFSQSYHNVAVKREKKTQAMSGGVVMGVYEWVDFTFLEFDDVDSRHWLDD